ncbi:MAG: DMT family transporter [Armatimonadota bacterium]|jgi:drug/metabolite transporter (DMT)-like permease
MQRRKLGLGDLFLVVVVIVWGINVPLTKLLLDQLTPVQIIGLRWPPFAISLVLLAIAMRRNLRIRRRDFGWLVLLAIPAVAANQFLWVIGLSTTLASRSALIFSTSAVFAGLLAPLFGGTPLRRVGWTGVGIALFGLYIVLSKGFTESLLDSPTSRGDLLTLCSALCVALVTAASRPFVRRYGSATFTTYAIALGALFITPIAAPSAIRADFGSLSLVSWLCLGHMIFLAGAVGFLCWFAGVDRIGPARTAVYQCIIPIMAIGASALLVNDRLTIAQLIGAAIALGGVLLARTDPGPEIRDQ